MKMRMQRKAGLRTVRGGVGVWQGSPDVAGLPRQGDRPCPTSHEFTIDGGGDLFYAFPLL